MIGIYKIINPEGRVYIGQSIDIEFRWRKYENLLNCKTQTKLYESLKKYGWNNHIAETVKECEEKDLNHYERYYQEFYDSVENGLNSRYTRSWHKSGKLSKKTVENLKLVLTGRKISVDHIENIRKSKKGVKQKIAVCPKCGKVGGISTLKQSHFDNCGIKVTRKKRKQ